MNDASTSTITPPPHAESDEAAGHGRHRGPVSAQDGETAPHGRHRREGGQPHTQTAA